MPLNWSISKCKDWQTLKSDEEWPITNALIWGTMSIGLPGITRKNLSEFYARVHTWETLLHSAFLQQSNAETGKIEDRPITVEDLYKRIGLSTNASTLTRTQWIRRVSEYVKNEMEGRKLEAERESYVRDAKETAPGEFNPADYPAVNAA